MNVEVPLEPFIIPFLMKIVLNVLRVIRILRNGQATSLWTCGVFWGEGQGLSSKTWEGFTKTVAFFFWVTLLTFHCILLEA